MTLAAITAVVHKRIGLDPAALGTSTFQRAVEGRMRSRGIVDAAVYTGLLDADPVEWNALLAELVVPESWFFRGGRSLFDHLARFIRERSSQEQVRILCAPCSTGEEPYSLAIALDECGIPTTRYRIDAVDLSEEHLLRAATARYTAFSFREPDADPRPRYFRHIADGRWELTPEITKAIRFQAGNLIASDFLAGESPFDLILCRNLFIYLSPVARTQVLSNLDRLLAHDGRLCLTPAEADRLPRDRFVADGPAGLSVFRRAAAPGERRDVSPTVHHEVPSGLRLDARQRLPGISPITVVTPTRADSARPTTVVTSSAASVRALADAGQLDTALRLCEQAITAAPTATLFGLLGILHVAAGRSSTAVEAFRKALYLDPEHAESLLHMAVLCDQQGDATQAAGFRRRLARLRQEETT